MENLNNGKFDQKAVEKRAKELESELGAGENSSGGGGVVSENATAPGLSLLDILPKSFVGVICHAPKTLQLEMALLTISDAVSPEHKAKLKTFTKLGDEERAAYEAILRDQLAGIPLESVSDGWKRVIQFMAWQIAGAYDIRNQAIAIIKEQKITDDIKAKFPGTEV